MKYSLTILALLLAACGGRPDFGTPAKSGDVVDTDVDREPSGARGMNDEAQDDFENEAPPESGGNNDPVVDMGAGQRVDFTPIIDATAELGFAAYEAESAATGSFVVGPYSLTRALANASLGTSGTARATLEDTAGNGLFGAELHNAFNTLDLDLTDRQSASQLDLLTAAWVPQSATVEQAFADDLARYYGTLVRRADFENRAADARISINNFYREETGGQLTDVVPTRTIDASTELLFTDGGVFRGTFEDAFDPEFTRPGTFSGQLGDRDIDMMVREGTIMGTTGNDYRAVELPFDGGYSLVMILPEEGAFDAVESRFDAAFFDNLLSRLVPSYLVLGVPRVTIGGRVDTRARAGALGLGEVFNADFSATFADARLTNVVQRMQLHIVEDGIMDDPTGLPPLDEAEADAADVPSIFFDRSFLFVVRDTQTGAILLMGRVS